MGKLDLEQNRALQHEGNVWINKNNSQLRYNSDENKTEWLSPMATYLPGNGSIKYGQPVAIGLKEQLSTQSYESDESAIVVVDPSKNNCTVGIALQPGTDESDTRIHVQCHGQVEYDLSRQSAEYYCPPNNGLVFNWTYDDIGKTVYVSNKNKGELTLDVAEAAFSGGTIISVGHLSDAPRPNETLNQKIVIDVQCAGDTRGVVDSTQISVQMASYESAIDADGSPLDKTYDYDRLIFVRIINDFGYFVLSDKSLLDNISCSPVGAFVLKAGVSLLDFSGKQILITRLGILTGDFSFAADSVGKTAYLNNGLISFTSSSAVEYKVGIYMDSDKFLVDCRYPKELAKSEMIGTIKPVFSSDLCDVGFTLIEPDKIHKVIYNKDNSISKSEAGIDWRELVTCCYTKDIFLFCYCEDGELPTDKSEFVRFADFGSEHTVDNPNVYFKFRDLYYSVNGNKSACQIKYTREGSPEAQSYIWPEESYRLILAPTSNADSYVLGGTSESSTLYCNITKLVELGAYMDNNSQNIEAYDIIVRDVTHNNQLISSGFFQKADGKWCGFEWQVKVIGSQTFLNMVTIPDGISSAECNGITYPLGTKLKVGDSIELLVTVRRRPTQYNTIYLNQFPLSNPWLPNITSEGNIVTKNGFIFGGITNVTESGVDVTDQIARIDINVNDSEDTTTKVTTVSGEKTAKYKDIVCFEKDGLNQSIVWNYDLESGVVSLNASFVLDFISFDTKNDLVNEYPFDTRVSDFFEKMKFKTFETKDPLFKQTYVTPTYPDSVSSEEATFYDYIFNNKSYIKYLNLLSLQAKAVAEVSAENKIISKKMYGGTDSADSNISLFDKSYLRFDSTQEPNVLYNLYEINKRLFPKEQAFGDIEKFGDLLKSFLIDNFIDYDSLEEPNLRYLSDDLPEFEQSISNLRKLYVFYRTFSSKKYIVNNDAFEYSEDDPERFMLLYKNNSLSASQIFFERQVGWNDESTGELYHNKASKLAEESGYFGSFFTWPLKPSIAYGDKKNYFLERSFFFNRLIGLNDEYVDERTGDNKSSSFAAQSLEGVTFDILSKLSYLKTLFTDEHKFSPYIAFLKPWTRYHKGFEYSIAEPVSKDSYYFEDYMKGAVYSGFSFSNDYLAEGYHSVMSYIPDRYFLFTKKFTNYNEATNFSDGYSNNYDSYLSKMENSISYKDMMDYWTAKQNNVFIKSYEDYFQNEPIFGTKRYVERYNIKNTSFSMRSSKTLMLMSYMDLLEFGYKLSEDIAVQEISSNAKNLSYFDEQLIKVIKDLDDSYCNIFGISSSFKSTKFTVGSSSEYDVDPGDDYLDEEEGDISDAVESFELYKIDRLSYYENMPPLKNLLYTAKPSGATDWPEWNYREATGLNGVMDEMAGEEAEKPEPTASDIVPAFVSDFETYRQYFVKTPYLYNCYSKTHMILLRSKLYSNLRNITAAQCNSLMTAFNKAVSTLKSLDWTTVSEDLNIKINSENLLVGDPVSEDSLNSQILIYQNSDFKGENLFVRFRDLPSDYNYDNSQKSISYKENDINKYIRTDIVDTSIITKPEKTYTKVVGKYKDKIEKNQPLVIFADEDTELRTMIDLLNHDSSDFITIAGTEYVKTKFVAETEPLNTFRNVTVDDNKAVFTFYDYAGNKKSYEYVIADFIDSGLNVTIPDNFESVLYEVDNISMAEEKIQSFETFSYIMADFANKVLGYTGSTITYRYPIFTTVVETAESEDLPDVTRIDKSYSETVTLTDNTLYFDKGLYFITEFHLPKNSFTAVDVCKVYEKQGILNLNNLKSISDDAKVLCLYDKTKDFSALSDYDFYTKESTTILYNKKEYSTASFEDYYNKFCNKKISNFIQVDTNTRTGQKDYYVSEDSLVLGKLNSEYSHDEVARLNEITSSADSLAKQVEETEQEISELQAAVAAKEARKAELEDNFDDLSDDEFKELKALRNYFKAKADFNSNIASLLSKKEELENKTELEDDEATELENINSKIAEFSKYEFYSFYLKNIELTELKTKLADAQATISKYEGAYKSNVQINEHNTLDKDVETYVSAIQKETTLKMSIMTAAFNDLASALNSNTESFNSFLEAYSKDFESINAAHKANAGNIKTLVENQSKMLAKVNEIVEALNTMEQTISDNDTNLRNDLADAISTSETKLSEDYNKKIGKVAEDIDNINSENYFSVYSVSKAKKATYTGTGFKAEATVAGADSNKKFSISKSDDLFVTVFDDLSETVDSFAEAIDWLKEAGVSVTVTDDTIEELSGLLSGGTDTTYSKNNSFVIRRN